MSPAPSAAVLDDPLAADDATDAPGSPQAAPARPERATPRVPHVEGFSGVQAIELLRTHGLIAAIEAVAANGLPPGLVVEQQPGAGTPSLRDGVVTLRVAQQDRSAAADVEPAPVASAGRDSAPDDTAAWFAALQPRAMATVSPRSTQRRRKERPRAPHAAARIESRRSVPRPTERSRAVPWRRLSLAIAGLLVALLVVAKTSTTAVRHTQLRNDLRAARARVTRPRSLRPARLVNTNARPERAGAPRSRGPRRRAVRSRSPQIHPSPSGATRDIPQADPEASPAPPPEASPSPPPSPQENTSDSPQFLYLGK